MLGLFLLVPTLLTILLSFLVVRAGAVALMMTGVEKEKANFQALSAFSRAGFTTREAESVINNPRRRRIISWLIILGNAGLVAVIVTATSSIATSTGYRLPISIIVILLGGFALYYLLNRTGLARRWEGFIENRLLGSRIIEDTTEDLLHLIGDYGVVRVIVAPDASSIGLSLGKVNAQNSEFQVLGIERGRKWISLPSSREVIQERDKLVIYGNFNTIKDIFR